MHFCLDALVLSVKLSALSAFGKEKLSSVGAGTAITPLAPATAIFGQPSLTLPKTTAAATSSFGFGLQSSTTPASVTAVTSGPLASTVTPCFSSLGKSEERQADGGKKAVHFAEPVVSTANSFDKPAPLPSADDEKPSTKKRNLAESSSSTSNATAATPFFFGLNSNAKPLDGSSVGVSGASAAQSASLVSLTNSAAKAPNTNATAAGDKAASAKLPTNAGVDFAFGTAPATSAVGSPSEPARDVKKGTSGLFGSSGATSGGFKFGGGLTGSDSKTTTADGASAALFPPLSFGGQSAGPSPSVVDGSGATTATPAAPFSFGGSSSNQGSLDSASPLSTLHCFFFCRRNASCWRAFLFGHSFQLRLLGAERGACFSRGLVSTPGSGVSSMNPLSLSPC